MDRMEREAAALAALGSSARLEVFRLLARHAPHAVPAGKIAAALGRRPNTLSVQVAALVRAGLVEGRREGKSILYRVSPARVSELVDWLSDDCCGGRPGLCGVPRQEDPAPAPRTAPLVAFLCTGDCSRSIIAAAMLNARARGRMRAVAAGAAPAPAPAPEVARLLEEMGESPAAHAPLDWRSLGGEEAAQPSFAFTLCDRAADAEHRFWRGRTFRSHWPLPDPMAEPDPAARMALFREVAAAISERVDALLALSPAEMNPAGIQAEIDRIGAAP